MDPNKESSATKTDGKHIITYTKICLGNISYDFMWQYQIEYVLLIMQSLNRRGLTVSAWCNYDNIMVFCEM